MDTTEAKQEIAELLDQADELVRQARDIAFECCSPADGVTDVDLQDVRDAIASVRGNIDDWVAAGGTGILYESPEATLVALDEIEAW